jgi:hypothetical protein
LRALFFEHIANEIGPDPVKIFNADLTRHASHGENAEMGQKNHLLIGTKGIGKAEIFHL